MAFLNAGYKEKEIYWFHPDHLGSSSYITGADGEVTQNIEYFPSGETFVVNHRNSNYSPYKFNGKELDAETGYYYGARYYNPRVSLWLNVDPLAEALPGRSPYEYTLSNPIRYTDPTGMYPDGGPGDEKIHNIQEVVITKRASWWQRNVARPIKNLFRGAPNLSNQKGIYTGVGTYTETSSGTNKYGAAAFYMGYNSKGDGYSTKNNLKLFYGEAETGMGEGKKNWALDFKLKAAMASAETKNTLGSENWNMFMEAKGDLVYAEAEATSGIYTGERGRYGFILGGGGKAGMGAAEVTSGYTFAGIRFGSTVGGCFECAEASAQLGAYYDNKKGNLVIRGYGALGLEGGARAGQFLEIPMLKFIKLTEKIIKIK